MDLDFGVLQWLGCATGLLGSALLAIKSNVSRYGWVAFGVSNVAWIGYGLWTGAMGLVVMQLGFCVTTTIGLTRWFARAEQTA